MIPNEMIEMGANVIGGIIDMTASLFAKIGEKKRATEKAIREESEAVENIFKAWTAANVTAFELVSTGSSKAPHDFIKSGWAYMLANPIKYDDKKDKISGNKKYFFEFNEVGNDVEISLKYEEQNNPQNDKIIMSQSFSKGAKIFSEGNVIQPLLYANEKAFEVVPQSLYSKAYQFNSGKSGLSLEEINFWKNGENGEAPIVVPSSTDYAGVNSTSKISKNAMVAVGVGVGILLIAIFVGMKKKSTT